MRCRECAALKATTLYRIHPGRLLLAFIVSLAGCTLVSEVLSFASFFVLFAGYYYGIGVSEVILYLTGRKRGPAVEAIGIVSIVGGALISYGVRFFMLYQVYSKGAAQNHMQTDPTSFFGGVVMSSLYGLVGIGIATVMCYRRLRE
jgi:hypothetical protein